MIKLKSCIRFICWFVLFGVLFISCADRKPDYNINKNKILAALEVYKLEDNYKAVVRIKNTAGDTKNLILFGEVRDSWGKYNKNKDVIFEVIQNGNHLYSNQIRFKNIVISEMMPEKYILEKDSVRAIYLDYIGDFRSDFNLDEGSFKIRAVIIPSRIHAEDYYKLNKETDDIKDLLMDTIKTQYLILD